MNPIEMRAHRRGHSSPNALAKALLAREDWPDPARNHRSLGNKLRDAMKGDRTWLDKDPLRLACLARELDWTEGELDEALAFSEQDSPPHLLLLPELFDARPIDLLQEPLYPGLPELACRPEAWAHHWWQVPHGPGHGHDHVARWLEARELARIVVARTGGEAARQLGGRTPTFVILGSDREAEALRPDRLPPGLRILVASPGPAPKDPQTEEPHRWRRRSRFDSPDRNSGSAWTQLSPPNARAGLRTLVHWARARLPPDAGLVEEELEAFLTSPEVLPFTITPGDSLAMVGLLNYRGLDLLTRHPPRDRVAAWLELSMSRLPSSARRDQLETRGPQLLLQLLRACWMGGHDPLLGGLDRAGWAALLPDGERITLDVEAIEARLVQGGPFAPEESRALLDALRSRPEAVVDSLLEAGLLRPVTGRGLAMGPFWVVAALQVESLNGLVDEGPAVFGEAALHPDSAIALLWLLVEKSQKGKWAGIALRGLSSMQGLLSQELGGKLVEVARSVSSDEERRDLFLGVLALIALQSRALSPALVAAWDLTLRALAIATLVEGRLPEPPDLPVDAEATRGFLPVLASIPFVLATVHTIPSRNRLLPILPLVPADEARGLAAPLGDHGLSLACLVLAPHLPPAVREGLPPLLRPLDQDDPPEGLIDLLRELGYLVPTPDPRGIAAALRRWSRPVVERFGAALGLADATPSLLRAPLAARQIHDGIALTGLDDLVKQGGASLEILLEETRALGLSEAATLDAIWAAELARDPSSGRSILHQLAQWEPAPRARLMSALPLALLRRESSVHLLRNSPELLACLSPEGWLAFLAHCGSPLLGEEEVPWDLVPPATLAAWLREHPPRTWQDRHRATLWWTHLPEQARDLIEGSGDLDIRFRLLFEAPSREHKHLVERLAANREAWTATESDRSSLFDWLRGVVAARGPAWRSALTLIRELAAT